MILTINKKSDTPEMISDTIDVTVHHDVCGNIFLKFKNSFYCLSIDQHDNIEFVEFFNFTSLPNNNDKINYSKIINTFEKKSLKGKLIKELDEQEYDEEVDEIENEGHYITKYKSYPEEKLYVSDNKQENDSNNESSNAVKLDDEYIEEYYEPYYKFSKYGEKAIVTCLEKSLEDMAIYDTFILNDNTSYVYLTLQSEEKSNYRVSILTTGIFILNIVGSKIKTYELFYFVNNQNEIEIGTKLIKTNMSL